MSVYIYTLIARIKLPKGLTFSLKNIIKMSQYLKTHFLHLVDI